MNKEIILDGKVISESSPAYIVAEMSANHLSDFDRAQTIIKEAKEAGADAIKLQTYTPDTITLDCNSSDFMADKGGLWEGTRLYDLYGSAYMPWEWQPRLKRFADKLGITCFSSPFDILAIDFMVEMGMPAIKIASYEINDVILIRHAAKKGLPLIISTGIAYLADIELALKICKEENNTNVILLKCTSAYPCPYEDMNIRQIQQLSRTFDCLTGLSDHTLGSEVALGSVALGARVIEKHVTLSRSDGGVDSAFSMEMQEFADMVSQIRNLEKALGTADYQLTPKQIASREGSRSLYVVKDVRAGEIFTPENIRSIRPGKGLHTRYYDLVIGKRAKTDLKKGTPLKVNSIDF